MEDPQPPPIINAALTGMVAQRDRFPHLPVSAQQVIEDATACHELGATILHVLGVDPTTEIPGALGRPLRINLGTPLTGLFA